MSQIGNPRTCPGDEHDGMGECPFCKRGERHVLVTFHVDGAWQPTSRETERTADFYAFPSSHVVDVWPCDGWRDRGEAPTTFHGEWPATEYGAHCARRFAASCSTATVREVPEYWYQPSYGRIES